MAAARDITSFDSTHFDSLVHPSQQLRVAQCSEDTVSVFLLGSA